MGERVCETLAGERPCGQARVLLHKLNTPSYPSSTPILSGLLLFSLKRGKTPAGVARQTHVTQQHFPSAPHRQSHRQPPSHFRGLPSLRRKKRRGGGEEVLCKEGERRRGDVYTSADLHSGGFCLPLEGKCRQGLHLGQAHSHTPQAHR